MDNTLDRNTLRVRGLSDVLHLIPSLLGFHPAESLVVVLVDGGRVAVTGRVDVGAVMGPDECNDCFGPLWERFPNALCVAAAYSSDTDAAWQALDALAATLPSAVVARLVHVHDGCWFAARDAPGRPYDPSCSAVAAEATYRGMRVLPDRGLLVDSLRPLADQSEMTDALERVISVPPERTVTSALMLAAAGMRRPPDLTTDEATVLAVAAFCPAFAETVATGIDASTAERARALWTAVVRATPPYAGAMAAVMLAMAAWVGGDGALVNVCLERAAPYAADTQWYRFLEIASRTALPPTQWDAVRRELLAAGDAA
jgi:hypothetical protein